MQACHWKAQNTFTNFYLKDLTWSDNDNNMFLGPVVAAQVLEPYPQTSYPRKEKKRGGEGHICYNQVFRSLIPGSRYMFTSSGCWVRSLSLLTCICIMLKDVLRLSFNLMLGWLRFMRFSGLGLVFTVAKP